MLGYTGVDQAIAYIKQAIKDGKVDAIYLACNSPQEKLVRGLKEVSTACEVTPPAVPGGGGRPRARAVSGETPAAIRARPPIVITQQSLRNLSKRASLAVEGLMNHEHKLEDVKAALRQAAAEGKLIGAGKSKPVPVSALQVLPKIINEDQQAAAALTEIKTKLDAGQGLTEQEIAKVEGLNKDWEATDKEMELYGVRINAQGLIEMFDQETGSWGPVQATGSVKAP